MGDRMLIHDHQAAASPRAPTNIGGKARGLVRLMRAGAQVPPWFVLTPGADPFAAVAAWREAGGTYGGVARALVTF